MMWAALLLLAPPARASVPPDRVQEEVRVQVARSAGVSPEDVEILHLGLAAPLDCPADAAILVESPPAERFRGHTRLTVTVGDPSHPCERTVLRTRLRIWATLPVAARDVVPGQVLSLSSGRVPLDQVEGVPLSPEALDGGPWISKVTLHAGEPVLATMVRPQPKAMSGDPVEIVGGEGVLEVRAPGRLLEDACHGDRVDVLNLATQQVQEGTLEPDGRVHLSRAQARHPTRTASAQDGP